MPKYIIFNGGKGGAHAFNAVKVIRYLFSKKYGKDTTFVYISIMCISASNKNLLWQPTDFKIQNRIVIIYCSVEAFI